MGLQQNYAKINCTHFIDAACVRAGFLHGHYNGQRTDYMSVLIGLALNHINGCQY